MKRKYIYCLTETNADKRYICSGVDGSNPVYTIRYRDIAAVSSDIESEVIKASKEDFLSHEKILEEVMKEGTALPFEFGTISPAKEDVIGLLNNNYSIIKNTIRYLCDKLEINVRAVWTNIDMVFKEIVSENRDIAVYKQEIQKKPAAKASADKIMIGQLVAQALNVKREKERDAIVTKLNREAVAHVPGRIMGDDMILNEAFLIKKGNSKRFEARLYELGDKLDGRINFKYAGHLPPYNFTNLRLKIRG